MDKGDIKLFVIVVVGGIAAMWLASKFLKLNNYDEYENFEEQNS